MHINKIVKARVAIVAAVVKTLNPAPVKQITLFFIFLLCYALLPQSVTCGCNIGGCDIIIYCPIYVVNINLRFVMFSLHNPNNRLNVYKKGGVFCKTRRPVRNPLFTAALTRYMRHFYGV